MKHRLKRILAFALVLLVLGSGIHSQTYAASSAEPTNAVTDIGDNDVPGVDENSAPTTTESPAPTSPVDEKTPSGSDEPQDNADGAAGTTANPADDGTDGSGSGEADAYVRTPIQLQVGDVEKLEFDPAATLTLEGGNWEQFSLGQDGSSLSISALKTGMASFKLVVQQAGEVQYLQYDVTVVDNPSQENEDDAAGTDADAGAGDAAPLTENEDEEPGANVGSQPENVQISVSFYISNPDYTQDPSSGNTHITVTEPFENSELQYEKWVRTYRVTGTGLLCSYTLPAGTSLQDNGYTLPKLSVTNIADGNQYTYQSSYTWLNESGSIVNQGTAFTEDTVLSLCLYQNYESYGLNFVCGLDENHSITYVLGGYPSATFALGQGVSQEYIPTAEDINANYSSEWCKHGKDYGETFVKWQLKNVETGEMVDFYAGMPITAEYLEAGTGTVKVYAVWSTGDEEIRQVTATFINGEETVERTLTPGSALGALPQPTTPEGYRFLGWEYTDSQGQAVFATADSIINESTTYTAKFAEIEEYTLSFSDVNHDGSVLHSFSLTAKAGQTLTQLFSQSAPMSDGTALTDCVWYSLDAQGEKQPVDLDAPISGEMALYTYSYQLILTLSPQQSLFARLASLVEVDEDRDGTLTLTITAREGVELKASDFVINGVDYSTYNWVDSEGETVNISQLITQGLTENVTATSTQKTQVTRNINFYIAIDGEWTLLNSGEMVVYDVGGDRYYLTAAQLESIYGFYGFTAGQLTEGGRLFPHTTGGDNNVWGNVAAISSDGVVYSPVLRKDDFAADVACDVYYVPGRQTSSSFGTADAAYLNANSFYSIHVSDPGHKVYDGSTEGLTVYTLSGEQASITLNTKEGVDWLCQGKDGAPATGYTETDNGDGTVTFVINNISQSYELSPAMESGEYLISYDVNLPYPASDGEYTSPTVGGEAQHTVLVKDGEGHAVLSPSLTQYFYEAGKYLGEATFTGWLSRDGTRYQPGDTINPTGNVTLTAQWTTKEGGTSGIVDQSTIVNFFVALTAIPEGGSSWTSSTETNFFTDSVYATDCGVTGSDTVYQELHISTDNIYNPSQYFVLGSTSGNSLNNIHTHLVNALTNGHMVEGNDGQIYTFRAQFPTDEEVLRQIRSMVNSGTVISLNGKTVSAEALTAENFTIKWHVFKFDTTDSWHIDGVLVAKTGLMRVEKTFSGDETAVQAVKENFSIEVTAEAYEGYEAPHPHYELTLDNCKSYDAATDTYTWEILVDQYRDYAVEENNYLYNVNGFTTSVSYNIINSDFSDQNTNGWVEYPGPLTVTGQSEDQAVHTVSFNNTYTRPGSIVLQKMDALTNSRVEGIDFTLARQDGTAIQIYDLGNCHYTYDHSEGGTLVNGNVITTDASGQAFLYLETGHTYTLTENVPQGYDDPGLISFTLDDNGIITAASSVGETASRDYVQITTGGTELRVNNYSKYVPLTVEKFWTDGENTEVVIQPFINGTAMGSRYRVALDTMHGWDETFDGTDSVPLYVGGQPAVYSLRELEIGDWSYSSEYGGDGYRYYDVTYSDMQYRIGGTLYDADDPAVDMAQVEEVYLSVSNKRSTGELSFSKVDQNNVPLSGAEFWLYEAPVTDPAAVTSTKDSDGHNILSGYGEARKAVSGANGTVSFGNVPTGNYYLVEHAAPQSYLGSDQVYLVEVQGFSFSIKEWSQGQWTERSKTFVNTLQTVEVTIEKQVEGNFGILSQPFSFTLNSSDVISSGTGYTLSDDGKTASFRLANGERVTLTLKKGSTITVTETGAEEYTMTAAADGDPLNVSNHSFTYTLPNDGTPHFDLIVTNTKNVDIDTGISLDSLPYVLILALVAVAVVVYIKRRRRPYDE